MFFSLCYNRLFRILKLYNILKSACCFLNGKHFFVPKFTEEGKKLCEYFYGEESNQFSFYRIPKSLFTNEYFKDVSAEAKILYGILLDRMSLSQRNGWMDELGRVYIIFTVEEIMEALGCQNQKVSKLMSELENKCGLVERKRQ